MGGKGISGDHYKRILSNYLRKQNEQGLYDAQQLTRNAIESEISPEEIVNLHSQALKQLCPDLSQDVKDSFDFLIEVMMGYGLAYREHQSLRHQQMELKSEIEVAANMQETLLKTKYPDVDSLDIGVLSKPAKKMNGDYFHFVQDEDDLVSVAVADVIGKGIPAALCMSMIKYSMDSLPETRMKPGAVLGNLNRVVEKNIDPSMFITMFYGIYDPHKHIFHYSAAGHEPGFFYNSQKECFEDLSIKGLVLGVSRDTKYNEGTLMVNKGDMIVLLTDGVTECRAGDEFIERDRIIELINKYKHLESKEIVENVYNELANLTEFQLNDDFTLIIFKRKV